jgi:putative transcriptional regulator
MKEDLFAELLESVRVGGAILRGRSKPARVTRVQEPNVRAIRRRYGLSQAKFAALMGISPATLRNWEQGRRKPEGSARVLLKVVDRHPNAVLDAVAESPPNKRVQRTRARSASHGRAALRAGG